jgi:hypothetical protein
MARRRNLFKRNDGLRALRIAREGGISVSMLEIVCADGTVFRVYGDNAGLTDSTKDATGAKDIQDAAAGAQEWAEEIARLKAATPKGRGKGK